MRRLTSTVILTGMLFAGILGLVMYKYRTDKTAWKQVQSGLVRLRSGIQFESVIALRSRLADADAAIKLYGSGWRVYPAEHDRRIRDAETALVYLNSALDWQTRSVTIETYVGPTAVYALGHLPNDVTSRFQRSCIGGEISFGGTALASAFGAAGISLLERAEYPIPRTLSADETFAPLNLEMEESECRRQETARKENQARIAAENVAQREAERKNQARIAAEKVAQKEAARKKYWSKWVYHVELELQALDDVCAGEVYADGHSTPLHLASSNLGGKKGEFGANEAMQIVVGCYSDVRGDRGPKDEIEVKINGQSYKPQWEKDRIGQKEGSSNKYRATILPLRQ
jgi:hypothetical protein